MFSVILSRLVNTTFFFGQCRFEFIAKSQAARCPEVFLGPLRVTEFLEYRRSFSENFGIVGIFKISTVYSLRA